ncbi:MAG: PhoH family protein [Nitrospirota bacterium]|nr:PhoH family protein [Nitrospirota bacterium]
MKKTFILDTNVLLHDPNALYQFAEHDIVIPIAVIEEMDRFKKGLDEMGRNARQVSRYLDELRLKDKLSTGVPLPTGGTLKVVLDKKQDDILPPELMLAKGDNRILAVAMQLNQVAKGPIIMVTKDTNMRIKADALGLIAEDYEAGQVDIEELYSGMMEIEADAADLDALYEGGLSVSNKHPHYPNQFVLLRDRDNSQHTALGRYEAARNAIVPIVSVKGGVWGINARNREQACALDLLLNDDIKLVTLVGKAGTGKTLLALAAGLEKTVERGSFQRLVVSRPIYPMGKDIGYLPGDIGEKLKPWMQPIFDNIDFLMGGGQGKGKVRRDAQSLVDMGMLELEALTYIRGRSLPHQYLIVDEAQNLTPHEIKTIVSRAGEGTKIVLTGDPYQIDNPYVDSSSNGLTYVAERFKEEAISGHITMVKGERSPLAELAASKL